MSTCRHRHSLLSLSLANTSRERQRQKRDTAPLFSFSFFFTRHSFPISFFFFLKKDGGGGLTWLWSSAAEQPSGAENEEMREEREKRLLTPKASRFPWAVFQLHMKASVILQLSSSQREHPHKPIVEEEAPVPPPRRPRTPRGSWQRLQEVNVSLTAFTNFHSPPPPLSLMSFV